MLDNQTAHDILESLDFAPVCEADLDEEISCSNPADFICSVVCCGRVVLLCEQCLFDWIEYVKDNPHVGFICYTCDTVHPRGIDPIKVLKRL